MRLLFFLCLTVLTACHQPKHNPCPDLPPLSNWDSIEDANILYKTRYSPDSLFEWKHLAQFDTAVSINLHDGWGCLHYYASLYIQANTVQSDLFQIVDNDWTILNDSFFKLPDIGYGRAKFGSMKKKNPAQNTLRSLIQVIDSSNFWCTPRYAGQCKISIDGLRWNLSVKTGNRFHQVQWTDCRFEHLDSNCVQDKCREMQAIAMRVFYAAGLPKNKYIVVSKGGKVGKDSTEYALWIPSYLWMGSKFYCRGNLVPEGGVLVVSNRDSDWFKYLEIQDLYSDDTNRYSPPVLWHK